MHNMVFMHSQPGLLISGWKGRGGLPPHTHTQRLIKPILTSILSCLDIIACDEVSVESVPHHFNWNCKTPVLFTECHYQVSSLYHYQFHHHIRLITVLLSLVSYQVTKTLKITQFFNGIF